MSNVSTAPVRAWHDELASLEEQIGALQEKKKHVYERIRRDFDRRTAEGMKAAMKYLRMDERKRVELFEFSDLGRKFIALVEEPDEAAHEWRSERNQKRATSFPVCNANAPIQTASAH